VCPVLPQPNRSPCGGVVLRADLVPSSARPQHLRRSAGCLEIGRVKAAPVRAGDADSRTRVGGGPTISVMEQFQPGGSPMVSPPPKWLWALPVFSCGLLAFVPAIMIAAKIKQSRAWWWAAGLTTAWFLGFALVSSQPEDADNVWSTSGVLFYLAAWIGGVVYSLVMGPKLDWSPKAFPVVAPTYDRNSAAMAEVQVGRQKRAAARELARRDPQMARDLRMGRPDLPRQYDDGGLVDVNSAPEEAMAKWLGLSAAQSAQVVEVRQHLGTFEHPEDLVNLAGLEPNTYDQVKDRIILL
jgi:DNA uptake protein ComE-like DNA-binding protein